MIMLILSRKKGEQFLIGEDVVVTVLQTGNPVRLGIEAPKEVRVMRAEIVTNKSNVGTLPQSK